LHWLGRRNDAGAATLRVTRTKTPWSQCFLQSKLVRELVHSAGNANASETGAVAASLEATSQKLPFGHCVEDGGWGFSSIVFASSLAFENTKDRNAFGASSEMVWR
jgi:hypothetical protein